MRVQLYSFTRSTLFCAALLGTLLVAATGYAQLQLGPKLITTGGSPSVVELALIDSDDLPDLLVGASDRGQIFLHFRQANGQFLFPLGLNAGGAVRDIEVGDIDGNGDLDILAVDGVNGELVVIRQFVDQPDRFQLQRLPGDDEPEHLLLYDFDSDGFPEPVVSYRGGDGLGVYQNTGGVLSRVEQFRVGDGPGQIVLLPASGSFSARFALAQEGVLSSNVGIYDLNIAPTQLLSVQDPGGLVVTDWDGNAYPDLISIDRSGRAHIHTGTAAGSLQPAGSWVVGAGASEVFPRRSEAGENGMVVLETGRGGVGVYYDVAGVPTTEGRYYVGESGGKSLWADVENDGLEELLVALPEENAVTIVRRDASGFLAHRTVESGAVPSHIQSTPAVGALPARIAVLALGSQEIWIYEPSSDGLVHVLTLPVPATARQFRFTPIDDDALPDLMVVTDGEGARFFRASGTGFEAAVDLAIDGDLRDVEFLKLDADNHADMAIASVTAGKVLLYHGDGTGAFTAGDSLSCTETAVVVRSDDYDADGFEDLLLLGASTKLCVQFARGDGTFARGEWAVGREPRSVAVADFNGDDVLDFAVGNALDGTYSVLVSATPRFYFFSVPEGFAPEGAQSVSLGDVDNNGVADLLLTSPSSNRISVHLGLGNGNFSLPLRIRCASLPLDLLGVDADLDGDDDVLVLDGRADSVVWIENIATQAGAPIPDDGGEIVAVPTTTSDSRFSMRLPWPNPSAAVVQFQMTAPGGETPSLHIYDARGRLVATPQLFGSSGGAYSATWRGLDRQGQSVAAGRYFAQWRAGDRREVRSLVRRPR